MNSDLGAEAYSLASDIESVAIDIAYMVDNTENAAPESLRLTAAVRMREALRILRAQQESLEVYG